MFFVVKRDIVGKKGMRLNMKKRTLIIVFILILLFCILGVLFFKQDKKYGCNVYYKTEGKEFLIYNKDKWEKEKILGVNMGTSLPGDKVNEKKITKEQYKKWFTQISEMNANSIRVYTWQSPEFYDALYEYNLSSDRKIYLQQGIWFEQETNEYKYSEKDKQTLKKEIEHTLNIIHGEYKDKTYAYSKDVSKYVIGYIIGAEWEASYLQTANQVERYNGKYLYSSDTASGFESFLAEIGDSLIEYETKKYNTQTPISFINWSTTDDIEHPLEPFKEEDTIGYTMENIKANDNYIAGLFATYHIYPTYPEFISLEYGSGIEAYDKYLKQLYEKSTMPIMIGEFGASSSRGISHIQINGDYKQGNLTEEEQGENIRNMIKVIMDNGYFGLSIFEWQDEWFKSVWNTADFVDRENEENWFNALNSEQSYGLLKYEPSDKSSQIYLDGNLQDWQENDIIEKNEEYTLYTKNDCGYLYIACKTNNYNIEDNRIVLPIKTSESYGKTEYDSLKFEEKVQFIIDIKEEPRMYVSEDYDIYQLKYNSPRDNYSFHKMYQYLRESVNINGKKYEEDTFEIGKLIKGKTNPEESDYNSLADYYIENNCIEMRIPWQMLNFTDPSNSKIAKIVGKSIKNEEIKSIKIGFGRYSDATVKLSKYKLNPWGDNVKYHERLKKSYYILKDTLKDYKDV